MFSISPHVKLLMLDSGFVRVTKLDVQLIATDGDGLSMARSEGLSSRMIRRKYHENFRKRARARGA